MLTYKSSWGEYNVNIALSSYVGNDNLAILLMEEDGCPFGSLSVNICDLPKDTICVDANNLAAAEDFIKEYSLGEPCGIMMPSGFCEYPVYKMDMDRLKELAVMDYRKANGVVEER